MPPNACALAWSEVRHFRADASHVPNDLVAAHLRLAAGEGRKIGVAAIRAYQVHVRAAQSAVRHLHLDAVRPERRRLERVRCEL